MSADSERVLVLLDGELAHPHLIGALEAMRAGRRALASEVSERKRLAKRVEALEDVRAAANRLRRETHLWVPRTENSIISATQAAALQELATALAAADGK